MKSNSYICGVNTFLTMSPTLADFAPRVLPSDYVESLSPYELYELGFEISKKDYFCECLDDVEDLSDEELSKNFDILKSRLNFLEKKDRRMLNFLFLQYI